MHFAVKFLLEVSSTYFSLAEVLQHMTESASRRSECIVNLEWVHSLMNREEYLGICLLLIQGNGNESFGVMETRVWFAFYKVVESWFPWKRLLRNCKSFCCAFTVSFNVLLLTSCSTRLRLLRIKTFDRIYIYSYINTVLASLIDYYLFVINISSKILEIKKKITCMFCSSTRRTLE